MGTLSGAIWGLIFSYATFDDVADFSGATFDDETSFVQAPFRGTVSFRSTDFRQGVDFRQASFDSAQTLYLENIKFPDGKLHFYWHQFQAKDSLRIKLRFPPADSLKQEHYNRIEIIYHRLRDNFLAQGDNASADYLKQKWRFLLVVLMLFVFNIYVWDGACKKQQISKKHSVLI